MQFIGISEKNFGARTTIMDDVTYQKVADSLKRGFQAMVFVHSRKDTGKTARSLALRAQQGGDLDLFDCSGEETHALYAREVQKSRNRELAEVFEAGGVGRVDGRVTGRVRCSICDERRIGLRRLSQIT